MAVSKFTPSETSSIYIGRKHSIVGTFVELLILINVLAFAIFFVDVLYCVANSRPLELHLVTAFLSVGGAVLLRRSGLKRLKKKIAATEDKEELERLRPLNNKDLWNEAALHTCSMGFYVVGALATISLLLPLLIVPFAAIFWKKYIKFVAWYQNAKQVCKKCDTFGDEWKEFGNWIHDQKLSALKPAELVEQYAKFCEAKAAKPVEAVKTNVLEQTAKDRNLRLEKEGLIVAWEFGKDFPVITGDPARVKLVKSEKGENLFAIYLDSELATGYQCK
jgi:hypothetical protein